MYTPCKQIVVPFTQQPVACMCRTCFHRQKALPCAFFALRRTAIYTTSIHKTPTCWKPINSLELPRYRVPLINSSYTALVLYMCMCSWPFLTSDSIISIFSFFPTTTPSFPLAKQVQTSKKQQDRTSKSQSVLNPGRRRVPTTLS